MPMPAFHQIALRTERLLLRPMAASDAQSLFTIFSEPRVARYLSRPPWPDLDTAHQRIARDLDALPAGKYLCLGLELAHDGRLIGECSLFNFNEQCRRAEVGYGLAFADWGHGYMREALTVLLGFGFSQLFLNRVEADIDPRNEGSAKSLERLGFTREGFLRERWIVDGEVSDTALYGLLAREWTSSHPRP